MDCTWLYGNNACDGGLDAFAWMLEKNNGQIATAESYGGYLNQDGFCHFGPVADQDGGMKMVDTNPWTHQKVLAGATIASCTHVTKDWNASTPTPVKSKMAALNDALYHIGPLSVSIDATPRSFYFYHSGYYESSECESGIDDLDHTVLAVGIVIRRKALHHCKEQLVRLLGKMECYISQANNTCGVGTSASFVNLKEK